MTTSEPKGRLFLQNESIHITNRIHSNRELECSTVQGHCVGQAEVTTTVNVGGTA